MKKLLQNIFFASCLLLIAGTVEAQTEGYAKKASTPPLPRTEEIQEHPPVQQAQEHQFNQPRRAVAPSIEMQVEQKTQQLLEEKAALELKTKKEAETTEQEKVRALEIDKPSNDEWRTKLEAENAKYESRVIAETVPENESRPIASKPNWQQLINQTETELQQATDPELQLKLQNKLNGLRKKAQEPSQQPVIK